MSAEEKPEFSSKFIEQKAQGLVVSSKREIQTIKLEERFISHI